MHCVPGHLGIVKNKAADARKGLCAVRLQDRITQLIRAEVQELQVWDATNNLADLEQIKGSKDTF